MLSKEICLVIGKVESMDIKIAIDLLKWFLLNMLTNFWKYYTTNTSFQVRLFLV